MFEHLIPNIVQKESSRKTSLTFYIIALLIAVGIFISSLGIDKGPLTSAYSYTFNKAEVQVNSKDNSMVPSVGNTSIFEFNILAKDNNTFLQKLKIYVQGLYKSTIFNDLKIYHNGVQLGYDAVFDNYGYLYFDLDNYSLSNGNNTFSFIIPSSDVNIGDIIQFSFEDPFSIVLSHGMDKSLFTPDATFPLKSGLISFVDKGSIYTYLDNFYPFFLPSNISHKLVSFSLGSLTEAVDIYNLSITCETEEYLDASLFVLLNNGLAISQGYYNQKDGIIDFILDDILVLNNKEDISLQLHTSKLLKGKYSFVLNSINGIGFSSGSDINIDDKLFLGDIYVKDNFLIIEDNNKYTSLSEGWNTIKEISIKSVNDSIELKKLSWFLESVATNLEDIEIYINNNKINNFTFNNNILTINNSLDIDKEGVVIEILINVSEVENGSIVKLLFDNILWFFDDNEYNEDMLPYLPLDPVILSSF